MMHNRPAYTHPKLRRRSLGQKVSDLCKKMQKPTPSVPHRDYARLFPSPDYFSSLSFTIPPSSLPPRTKRVTKALLKLLLPLEAAYLSGDNKAYHRQLSKLKKLDSGIGTDFETAILEAKDFGMDRAYLGYVRRGLDRRNNWQGVGVFSFLAYKSEWIIGQLNSAIHVADLVESGQLARHDIEKHVATYRDQIDRVNTKTADDVTAIWTANLGLKGMRQATVELMEDWKSAVQKNLISHFVTPLSSPSSSTKTSPLLAYLPFLAFNKTIVAKRPNSHQFFKSPLDVILILGTAGGSSVAAVTIKRSEYSSGDDSASLESFDQEDSVFEFRYEPTGPVDGPLSTSGRE